MSDRGRKSTPMDQAAKSRVMSAEYKKNDGRATDWSRRTQSAADRNDSSSRAQSEADGSDGGSWQCTML